MLGFKLNGQKKLNRMVIQLSDLSDELDIDFPDALFDLQEFEISSEDAAHYDYLKIFNKALKVGKPIIEIGAEYWGFPNFTIGTIEEVEGKFKTYIQKLEEKLSKIEEHNSKEWEQERKEHRDDRIKALKKELAKLEKEKASEK